MYIILWLHFLRPATALASPLAPPLASLLPSPLASSGLPSVLASRWSWPKSSIDYDEMVMRAASPMAHTERGEELARAALTPGLSPGVGEAGVGLSTEGVGLA